MSNPNPSNVTASVNAKLKNIAKEKKLDFGYLLTRYGAERFLYRLSISEYNRHFVLKGGALFIIWQHGFSFRPTRDSDFMYFGNADETHLREVFRSVCQLEVDYADGMRFDADSIEVAPIRENMEYGGNRVILNAFLGNAKILLQFDIGVGDAITPPPEIEEFPAILGGTVPRLKVYPSYTVIAEKVEAMIKLGMDNSRMKDFYDVWLLSELFDYEFDILRRAILNTFERRGTTLPGELPLCFSADFCSSPIKQTQWNAFCRKNRLKQCPENLEAALLRIKAMILPVLFLPDPLPVVWQKGNDWTDNGIVQCIANSI